MQILVLIKNYMKWHKKNMSSYTLQLYIYFKKTTFSNVLILISFWIIPQMHIQSQKKSEGLDIVQNVSE